MGNNKRNNVKITSPMKCWVTRWVKETMTELGYPNLKIKISWRRMISKVGISKWKIHKTSTGEKIKVSNFEIVLSETLWPFLSKEERYETIVHECCHLVNAIMNEDNPNEPHDDNWIILMKKLGRIGEPDINVKILSGIF